MKKIPLEQYLQAIKECPDEIFVQRGKRKIWIPSSEFKEGKEWLGMKNGKPYAFRTGDRWLNDKVGHLYGITCNYHILFDPFSVDKIVGLLKSKEYHNFEKEIIHLYREEGFDGYLFSDTEQDARAYRKARGAAARILIKKNVSTQYSAYHSSEWDVHFRFPYINCHGKSNRNDLVCLKTVTSGNPDKPIPRKELGKRTVALIGSLGDFMIANRIKAYFEPTFMNSPRLPHQKFVAYNPGK